MPTGLNTDQAKGQFLLGDLKIDVVTVIKQMLLFMLNCFLQTIKFKSYLLSMGIPNPVTRDTHGSGDKYYTELARQLSNVLEKPLKVRIHQHL